MLQGIFMSNQGMVGDRKGDFANAVLEIMPTGMAPLLAMSSGMQKEAATDTTFTWFEDVHISGRAQVVSGGTTTTVVVNDGSFYAPGNVLLVQDTGEIILVTATSGNSLTVIRGMSGTAIVSLTSSMFVQQIGNAREEASGRPTAISQQGAPRINYVQIFRNAWSVSGTAKAVSFHTGNRLAVNKQQCAMYHAEDMERSMIWGRKHVGIFNNRQFRMSDGLLIQIEQNGGTIETAAVQATPGRYNLAAFDEFMRRVFARNVKGQPNERIAFCGDILLARFNQMARLNAHYNISVNETKWGIAITEFSGPFGKLKLVTHPLMVENPVWQREMYVFHPGGIKRRVLRDTFYENYDSNGNRILGVDADEGLMTTELGWQCAAASTMGILRNVNEAVAG